MLTTVILVAVLFILLNILFGGYVTGAYERNGMEEMMYLVNGWVGTSIFIGLVIVFACVVSFLI